MAQCAHECWHPGIGACRAGRPECFHSEAARPALKPECLHSAAARLALEILRFVFGYSAFSVADLGCLHPDKGVVRGEFASGPSYNCETRSEGGKLPKSVCFPFALDRSGFGFSKRGPRVHAHASVQIRKVCFRMQRA